MLRASPEQLAGLCTGLDYIRLDGCSDTGGAALPPSTLTLTIPLYRMPPAHVTAAIVEARGCRVDAYR